MSLEEENHILAEGMRKVWTLDFSLPRGRSQGNVYMRFSVGAMLQAVIVLPPARLIEGRVKCHFGTRSEMLALYDSWSVGGE